MPRFPKWTWAPSQFGVERSDGEGRQPVAPPRPCLASVEKLDARLLFSVNIDPFVIVKHIDKSTPILAVAEANALMPVPGVSTGGDYKAQFVEMANEFYKIDTALLKYEDDILAHKVAPTEGTDAAQGINDIFLKIEGLATSLDGGTGALLPAVQKVYDAVFGAAGAEGGASFLGDLSTLAAMDLSSLPDAETDVLAKMAGDFWKLGAVAIDYKSEIIQGVPLDVAQKQATSKEKVEYLKIELESVLVSSFISPADQKDLGATIDQSLALVDGVVNPSTPEVGLTVPGGTGDTIL